MRNIIVPTDFSDNAFDALRYACQLFKYERSDIYLLHCCDPGAEEPHEEGRGSTITKSQAGISTVRKTALLDLKERVHSYAPNPNHKYITYLTKGMLPDEINDLVDQLDADVVVMGTRGETNDRSSTFGSNTMQVFRYVKCPVLAVPENYRYTSPKHILFPNHLMKPIRRRELKLLHEIGKSFRSTVHLLYVNALQPLSKRQEENYSFLRQCLDGLELIRETEKGEDLYTTIRNFQEKNTIDLLVMVNQRNRHQEDHLGPSAVDRLGLTTQVPFLVLQNLYR